MNRRSEYIEPSANDATFEAAPSELVHSLLRLWQIAQYRRKTIVQAVCVAAMVGSVYFALATRYYDSKAKLLIVHRDTDQVASVGDQPALDSTMATHRELVVSPVVIQQAIELLLPEHRVDFQDEPPSEWSRILAEGLSARTTRKANFIDVRYRSRSPEAASAVVSAVIQAYLQFVDRTHKGSASEVITKFSQERDEVTQQLAARQSERDEVSRAIGRLQTEDEQGIVDPKIQGAMQLHNGLIEIRQRLAKLQSMQATIKQAMSSGDNLQNYVVGLEEVVGRQMLISALGLTPQDLALVKSQEQKLLEAHAELNRISPFYGPGHPKVAEVSDRIQTIQQYLENYRAHTGERLAAFDNSELGPVIERMLNQSIAQTIQEEQRLRLEYEKAHEEAMQRNSDIVRLQNLDREIRRIEAQQDALVEKISNVDIQQAPIQATVVQEPLPDEDPDSPQLRIVALASLMGGLFVGGVIAYVQDVLDDRFASPEEMSTQLGVAVLSMVRKLDALEGDGLAKVHTHLAPNKPETESFRTLRTALTLSAGATDRIAVSSAEPGDGKTTITANLAVSFAQAGKKTIVIDADLRKPGMTALMGLKGQPGVADVLYGSEHPATTAAALVHKTELELLDVLPAGLRRPNPAELLGGQNFVELLAWAEANYDQILVDCPPVLAVSDAQIVGRLVDGAILVVQPLKNHRRLVSRACHSFSATGTNVLGIVANGLSQQTGRGYGYAYEYGHGYGYGYGHDTSTEELHHSDETPQNTTGRIAA